MSLTPGARLGPYEIVAAIGAGGMGEVYKARDTRLDRTVAIKIIGDDLAGTPDLRDRFEREARTISQLNHPGICTLHDVGREGDVSYLVLEFIDGETLASRISRGPMPPEEALPVAIAVCEALDAAHRLGIVHRDLKPGNIMLARTAKHGASGRAGQAKLLDFGLAKLAQGVAPPPGGATLAPTITTPLTARGSMIGTFQYMAPEQLEGAEADVRSDIWAFGCVLYEMVTGRRAFDGKSQATLISAILATEPPSLASIQPLASTALDYTVRTCLAKDPEERFQNAHDLLLQLRWIATAGSEAGAPAVVATRRRSRSRLQLAAAVAATVVLTGVPVWWVSSSTDSPAPAPLRADVMLPPGTFMVPSVTRNIALSPDGTKLVFVSVAGDEFRLRVRDLSTGATRPITGTEAGVMPFFSPDGQWIGFSAGGKLRKAPLAGGPAAIICDVPGVFGAAWAPDDTIIFAGGPGRPLMRVPASGGEPTALTTIEEGEFDHRWPAVLPDGQAVLYAASTAGGVAEGKIVLQPLDGGARTVVAHGGTSPLYVSTGHLLFVRDSTLHAQPFDLRSRSVHGTARAMVENVGHAVSDGRAQYAVSATGLLAYVEGQQVAPQRTLVWVTRDGEVQPLPVEQRAFDHPRLSPDGRYAAVTVRDPDPDVWTIDLSRMTLSRFTFEQGEEESPVWSPDSRRITFSASRIGKPRQTLSKAIDGSGSEEELFTTTRHQHLGGWTPDGQTLLTEEVEVNWTLFAGNRSTKSWTPLTSSRFAANGVQVSPDGRWIAYSTNEGGTHEVYVQAFPGPGSRAQVSSRGGTEPRWSPAGDELFYRAGDRMMAVSIRTTPTLVVETPRVLFEGRFARMGWGQANYDVTRDGKRFLMVQGLDEALPTSFKVIANWFEELKAVSPTR